MLDSRQYPVAARRFDPTAHRPKSQRLRLGVRGAAGTGKSTFAASLAEAGLGRLCFFDTELKSCHLPGSDGSRFDAFEIADPDELAAAILWALREEEGRARGYGAYSLDSWNGWFASTYARFLDAKRAATGLRFPELDGDDLQRLQVVAGEILRLLCIDTHACVVITDTIAAKGMEAREDYEVGRIVPISASGLEYAVDVLVEADLRLAPDGFSQIYVHRVVKSNTPAFTIGDELVNPSFQDYLVRLNAPNVATAETVQAETSAAAAARALLSAPVASAAESGPAIEVLLQDLLAKAEQHGFSRANVVTAAQSHCGKGNLEALTRDEIRLLDRRLDNAKRPAGSSGPTGTTQQMSPGRLDGPHGPAGEADGVTPLEAIIEITPAAGGAPAASPQLPQLRQSGSQTATPPTPNRTQTRGTTSSTAPGTTLARSNSSTANGARPPQQPSH